MAAPPAKSNGLVVRTAAELIAEARSLRLSGPRAATAARAATAVTTAVLAALSLRMDNPWWAGISAARVIEGDARETLWRGVDCLAGTLAGAVAGYLLAGVSEDHLLVELGLFFLAVIVLYGQGRSAHSHGMVMLGVTTVIVVFSTLDAPAPLVLIPPIWSLLELPGLSQTPITAYVILAAAHDAQAWRAVNRVLGCLIGGAIGLLMMKLVGDAFIPWTVMLFAGAFVFAQIEHGTSQFAYVGTQAGIAFLIAVVQGPAASNDIMPAIDRLCGVIGGVAVAGAVTIALAPLRRLLERWMTRAAAESDG